MRHCLVIPLQSRYCHYAVIELGANIADAFNGMHEALEAITEAVNSLPSIYAKIF